MIDNASISVRLQNLAARLAVPYLNFNPAQEQRLLNQIRELESLLAEVEKAA
jgi:hypothetical protein